MERVLERPEITSKKINPWFSDGELDYFKNIILNKRKDAVEEMNFLEANLREMRDADSDDASSTMHHMADVASDEQGIAMKYRLIERTRAFVMQLDRALERIENGTYGICRVTGKPIEKERLEFAPHTRYSMEAKLKGLDKKPGVSYVQ
jgi:DnaK suppressor protein